MIDNSFFFSFPVSQVCKGPPQHEEVCLGLFTLVLTEPAQAQKVRRAAGDPRPCQYDRGLGGASYLTL